MIGIKLPNTETLKDLGLDVREGRPKLYDQCKFEWRHNCMSAGFQARSSLTEKRKDANNINGLDLSIHMVTADDLLCGLLDCRKNKNLILAKRAQDQIYGIGLDQLLGNQFVPTFVDCGSMHDAQLAFNKLCSRDEYNWTYLLQGYIDNGEPQYALELFQGMRDDFIRPSRYTYVVLLRACTKMKCLGREREIHYDIIIEGYEKDTFVCRTLVDVYMQIGSSAEACDVFEELPEKDAVLWAAMIGGYTKRGLHVEALSCFKRMQGEGVPSDRFIYTSCLKSCTRLETLDTGQEIHCQIIKDGLDTDLFVSSALINMYAKCGLLMEAEKLLSLRPSCNVILWNALIAGYLKLDLAEECLNCLKTMKSNNISPNEVTFVSCLKACVSIGALDAGREIHAQIIKSGFEKDTFLGSILMDMYMKWGSLQEAHKIFCELTTRDVVSWTALIAGYIEHGFYQEALYRLEEMQADGTCADALTFICVLKGCGNTKAIKSGFEVHCEIIKRGLEEDYSMGDALMEMYTELHLIDEALFVFDKLPIKDIVSWNTLIGSLTKYEFAEEALKCLDRLKLQCTCRNITTFIHSLRASASLEDAERGFNLHADIVKNGFDTDLFVGNILVDAYSKCGCLLEAQNVFDGLSIQSSVSWSSLISGYAEHGHDEQVLDCLECMRRDNVCEEDVVTYICSLKACSNIRAFDEGLKLYMEIVKDGLERDIVLGSTVVDMFAKWGAISDAQEVLDELPVRNVVSWTALLAAYAEHACFEDTMRCWQQMQLEGITPNVVTYASILKACSIDRVLRFGRSIHSEILKLGFHGDAAICSTLVEMYAVCGLFLEAQEVLSKFSIKDILSWNALIGCYSDHGQDHEALTCFLGMQNEGVEPNVMTYIQVLKACRNLDFGNELYIEIAKKGFESDFLLNSSVLNMYATEGAFHEAKRVSNYFPQDPTSWNLLIGGYMDQGLLQEGIDCFEEMQHKGVIPDVVSWNKVLLHCAEQGKNERVLLMYSQMQEQGILADSATFVSILQTCGNVACLELGERTYALCCRGGHIRASEIMLVTAIIDMYGKCGKMRSAQCLFDAMPIRNTMMWNALIIGYSRQGECEHAIEVFERMKMVTEPDAVTFLCVLTACNHAGLMDRAENYFESMGAYGIDSSIKHHNCMIDLLARAGRLQDALNLLKRMPFQPNDSTLNTILGACRKWNNVAAAEELFQYALRSNEKRTGTFVLMSNIYADFQIWDKSQEMMQ